MDPMPATLLPLLTALTLVSLLLSIIFELAWRGMNRPRHARTWALAYALGAVEWIMNLVEGTLFKGGVLYWTVAALPLLVSMMLAIVGFRQRSGLPVRGAVLAGIAGAVTLATWLSAAVWRHGGINVALLPLCATAMLPFGIHALLRRAGRRSRAEWACIAMLALFTGFEAGVTILALGIGRSFDNGAAYDLYLLVLFTGLPSFYIGVGISALFLLTADQTAALDHLARHDGMTGILNRRAFHDTARSLLRDRGGGCLVVCDIDHFKRINDRWGHATGDLVIVAAVDVLRHGLRANDVIGRIGGEEFAMVLPRVDMTAAVALCERLGAAMAGIAIDGHPEIAVTLSFGVTRYDPDRPSLEIAVHAADQALYRAKAGGRNRVMTAA